MGRAPFLFQFSFTSYLLLTACVISAGLLAYLAPLALHRGLDVNKSLEVPGRTRMGTPSKKFMTVYVRSLLRWFNICFAPALLYRTECSCARSGLDA